MFYTHLIFFCLFVSLIDDIGVTRISTVSTEYGHCPRLVVTKKDDEILKGDSSLVRHLLGVVFPSMSFT